MKKRLTSIMLILCMVCTGFPLMKIAPVIAASTDVYVLSYPSKIVYELGEEFDTTGFKVVTAGSRQTSVNDKIAFYTSNTVELTQGREFQTDGVKIVELRHNGKKVGAYEITVNKQMAAPTRESGAGVTIESFPTKTVYKYKEKFDISGLKVVTNDSKKIDVTDKITFISTVYGWELTKNYKMDFANRGEYRISLQYNDKKIGEYSIITKGNPIYVTQAEEKVKNGWRAFALGSSDNLNYVTIDANGNAELRKGGASYKYYLNNAATRGGDGSNYKFYLENRGATNKREVQVTLKLPDGGYLGVGEIKNGVQLKVVNDPYVWFYSPTNGYLYPPAYSNMLANASGKSYKDGTKIILWNQPYSIYKYKHASFSMITTTDPAGIEKGLYLLTMRNQYLRPTFFDKIGGNIVGYWSYSPVVVNVTESKGDWAKVTFKGRTRYISTRLIGLKKISQPDIVCSPWAKKWWAYTGSVIGTTSDYPKAKTEWTKTITNDDMATLLVGIMNDIYGDWSVQYSSIFTKDRSTVSWKLEDNDDNWYVKDRLFRWGVITDPKIKWKVNPTYGEFTTYLIKLIAFDKKASDGIGYTLTAADIKKFAIGGNTKASAKITKEQAYILCEKVLDWYKAKSYAESIKFAQKNPTHSALSKTVGTGVYTITSNLGKKPNLVINKKGQGELNRKKTQKFKITYLGGARNTFGNWSAKYTIQTMDGKYLALRSAFKNGSRLITQKKSYVWNITENVVGQVVIRPWDNSYQLLNASESKTADGTPVITWFWNTGDNGLVTPTDNCDFRFSYVGKK